MKWYSLAPLLPNSISCDASEVGWPMANDSKTLSIQPNSIISTGYHLRPQEISSVSIRSMFNLGDGSSTSHLVLPKQLQHWHHKMGH